MIPPVDKDLLEGDDFDTYRPGWMKWYYTLWSESTALFDSDQCGWYMRLLMHAASQGNPLGYLLDDDEELKEIAHFTSLPKEMLKIIDKDVSSIAYSTLDSIKEMREAKWVKVRSKFKKSDVHRGYVFNQKLLNTLKDAYKTVKATSRAGKLGAEAHWGKHKKAKEVNSNAYGDANSTLDGDAYGDAIAILDKDKDKELREKTKAKKSVDVKDVQDIFVFWRTEMNKTLSTTLTPERKVKIQARLKQGYTVEQIKNAILGCKSSEHHMGSTGTLYNDIELICRNGSKLEGFIEKYELSKTQPAARRQDSGQKPWESASQRNERLEREEREYSQQLLIRSQERNQKDPPGLSLASDDDA